MRLAFSIFFVAFLLQAKDLTVPADAHLLRAVEGRGVQIYSCKQTDGTFQWAFQAPEAKLFDTSTHEQVGTHGAGPVWMWKDGSGVRGSVVEKSPSPEPDSIPWLLLKASAVDEKAGVLKGVAWVRRSETHGGDAPGVGCDAAHAGAVSRVEYTATYSFYLGGGAAQ